MSTISDRVAYLKGLCDGVKLSEQSDEGRVLRAVIDALGTVSEEMDRLQAAQGELESYIEDIDEDLEELEDTLFGDDEDDEDEGEEDEDGEDDDGEDGLIEYDCPHCGTSIYFDEEAFDLEEEHLCPNCGKPVFGEVPSDDEDDDEGDDDDE